VRVMTFTEKFLRARPAIEVAGRSVKRYHVTPGPEGVEPEVEQAALAILPKLLPEPDGTPPATFVVVHRSLADNAAYINAYSWVWDNVLYFRCAAAGQPELGCPDKDPTSFMVVEDRPWIGCVWELPPIAHERDAWVRHLLLPDQPDLTAYLADFMPDGLTGRVA
jgi:hypothetical protein